MGSSASDLVTMICLCGEETERRSNATGDGDVGVVRLGMGMSMGSGEDPEEVDERLGDGDVGEENVEVIGAVRAAGRIRAMSPLGRRVGTNWRPWIMLESGVRRMRT